MAFEMLLPTLPLYIVDIGGNESQIGLVSSVFMLSAILVRLFPGVLSSLMDKKYLLTIGIFICALATYLYSISDSIYLLIIMRILHGLGFGIATTLFATFVAHSVPTNRLGEGMGFFAVGETLAISIGPLIGVWLIEKFGFTPLFTTSSLIIFLALLMTLTTKNSTKKESKTFEWGFKLFEKRVLFPASLVLLSGLAAGSIMSFAALYAKKMGFSNTAWFFFTIAIAGFVIRMFSGKIYDKKGPAMIIFGGSLFSIAGLVIVAASTTEFQFILASVFYGAGFGAIFPALQAWCSQLVSLNDQESAMATFFNFFDLGIGGGSLILGVIATLISYQAIYFVAAAAYILIILIFAVKSKNTTILVQQHSIKNNS